MTSYKRVYFRINTPSYYNNKYGVGFSTPEEGSLFQKIMTDLFLSAGWSIKVERNSSGHCNTIIKDKQELYLHPQSISGVILEENIPVIENLLSNNDLFTFRNTDIYEDVFDITDEEYLNILKSKRSEIEQDILSIYKTKRKNLYITDTWTPVSRVVDKYRIKRLSHYVGVISSSDIDIQYIGELFKNLVAEDKITTAETKHGTGYRSVA
jgi:hypothetical protein